MCCFLCQCRGQVLLGSIFELWRWVSVGCVIPQCCSEVSGPSVRAPASGKAEFEVQELLLDGKVCKELSLLLKGSVGRGCLTRVMNGDSGIVHSTTCVLAVFGWSSASSIYPLPRFNAIFLLYFEIWIQVLKVDGLDWSKLWKSSVRLCVFRGRVKQIWLKCNVSCDSLPVWGCSVCTLEV